MKVRGIWDATTNEIVIAVEKDGIRYYTNQSMFYQLLDSEVKHIRGEVREYTRVSLIAEV